MSALIHTYRELVAAKDAKKCVLAPKAYHGCFRQRLPAAVVLNMNFSIVSQALESGFQIYEPMPKQKKTTKPTP